LLSARSLEQMISENGHVSPASTNRCKNVPERVGEDNGNKSYFEGSLFTPPSYSFDDPNKKTQAMASTRAIMMCGNIDLKVDTQKINRNLGE